MRTSHATRITAALAATALGLTGLALAGAIPASAASTAPTAVSAKTITPTSKQLSSWGFTKDPNVTDWAPGGSAQVSATSLPAWGDLYITGKAPKGTSAGQVLSLKRFVPTDKKGSGYFQDLGITTKVNKNRTFELHAQLGRQGLYGYSVGYETGGSSPEAITFEFQLKTTKGMAPKTLAASSSPTSKQLATWGFTTKPNVAAWGPKGTAKLSATSAKAGQSVVLRGKAPQGTTPGTVLSLKRFYPTDNKGSGYFKAVNATTKVTNEGTYKLRFDLGLVGRYGYTVGFPQAYAWTGVEFQLQTT
jgi:hypothetical protein